MPAGRAVISFRRLSFFRLADHLKRQPASNGRSFFEAGFDRAAEAVGVAALNTDQCAVFFVKGKIFMTETARRDKAIRASFVQSNEQAEFRHARDARVKCRADAVREIGGDIAVFGIAFGNHGFAFRGRDMLRDFLQAIGYAGPPYQQFH